MDRKAISSLGGKARARTLSRERRSAIAKEGWKAMVDARFGGDSEAAKAWLVAKGLAFQDKNLQAGLVSLRGRLFYQAPEPEEIPS